MIWCEQFVKFDSSAPFEIVPRLENFSGYGPAAAQESALSDLIENVPFTSLAAILIARS